jgi:hypothetical protein
MDVIIFVRKKSTANTAKENLTATPKPNEEVPEISG